MKSVFSGRFVFPEIQHPSVTQRAEQEKMKSQAECKRALQEMRRFEAKQDSVQDLKRQVNAERCITSNAQLGQFKEAHDRV